MKLKCTPWMGEDVHKCLGQDVSLMVEIPDWNPTTMEEDYGDMEQYIDEVAGDKIEAVLGHTVRGFMWTIEKEGGIH